MAAEVFTCAVPQNALAQAAAGACAWPHRGVRFGLDPSLTSLGLPANTWTGILWQFGQLLEALDAHHVEVRAVPEGTQDRANVWSRAEPMGGPGGVLAEAQLPCGVVTWSRLWQRYDTADRWSAELALLAYVHESLHSLGLDHDGTPGSILNPSLGVGRNQVDLTHPANSRVVAALRARYPRTSPVPIPPKPPPVPVPPPMPPGRWARIRYLAPGGWMSRGEVKEIEVWTR